MVRSFLPVGQGAFCCESFEGFFWNRRLNVVYDCGSITSIEIVKKEIRSQFFQGEVIDAVFISHLDEDHVNGLPDLLKYCEVKKIYLPLISSDDKRMMKIDFEIRGVTGFVYNFLDNPSQTIRELDIGYEIEVIQIRDSGEERNDYDIRTITSGENVFEDIKKSSKEHHVDEMFEWLYIPFNFRQRQRKEQLLDELERRFGERISEAELENLWRSGLNYDRQIIREAYKTVPGGLNTNSMTVFSGTTDSELKQSVMARNVSCVRYCRYRCNCKPSGCLYTGDYDASGSSKWEDLKKAYDKYWKYIGCVQVPHHGSRHNFNEGILDLDAFYIISAGVANKYRHPHSAVIKKFLLKRRTLFIITEEVGSGVYMYVYQ